jgi:hypothetical protein
MIIFHQTLFILLINILMSDNDNRLYWYEDYKELVVTVDNLYVNNSPMNNRNLKAHKGLTNEILFNIRDRDRKLQDIDAYVLSAHLIDPNTRRRILTRRLINTADVGKSKLVLTEADLADVNAGRYYIYVERQNSQVESLPLYKDQDNNVRFDIEITDQVGVEPVPTQESTDFILSNSVAEGGDMDVYVSQTLYGNLCRNFTNAQHTMAIYLENYTGLIKVQASCLESVPDSDYASTDWFDVRELELSDTQQRVAVLSFVVNCNWVRIQSRPTNGSVEKVILRN